MDVFVYLILAAVAICAKAQTGPGASSLTSAPQTGGALQYPYNMQQGNQILSMPTRLHGHQAMPTLRGPMEQYMMQVRQMRNQNTPTPGNYGNQIQGNNGMSMLPFFFGGDSMRRFAAMNMMMRPGQSNSILPLALMEGGDNMLPLAMLSGQNNNRGQYNQRGSQNSGFNPMMWMAFDGLMN